MSNNVMSLAVTKTGAMATYKAKEEKREREEWREERKRRVERRGEEEERKRNSVVEAELCYLQEGQYAYLMCPAVSKFQVGGCTHHILSFSPSPSPPLAPLSSLFSLLSLISPSSFSQKMERETLAFVSGTLSPSPLRHKNSTPRSTSASRNQVQLFLGRR